MKNRYRPGLLTTSTVLIGAMTASASAQWVSFSNQTNSRIQSDNTAFTTSDFQERDYSYGDLNNNGWIDLVAMRKQPGTSTGRRVNRLFMNENGVLVDRTAEYASAVNQSMLPGGTTDEGFLTETNDRDSVLSDLNNNGWLDLVTATTISNGQPKHIGYPRVYMNLGADSSGDWQGLIFENDRIPLMESMPHMPRFCAVDAGDLTGNGYADLYFGDYDGGLAGGGAPMTLDFNDRILINDGNAFFADESTQRVQNNSWLSTAFTTAVVIADMNDNGRNDIVRVNSLGGYQNNIFYNSSNEGFFNQFQNAVGGSPYYVAVADLNNNGRLDMVLGRDGNDIVQFNQGAGFTGQVSWNNQTLPSSFGFRSNITIADLNNNGFKDIWISDMDVDLLNCNNNANVANIYRNNNGTSFSADDGNISGAANLRNTFDAAIFDINGNGWNDIVQARCSNAGAGKGTTVWMNNPSFGINIGLGSIPSTVDAEDEIALQFTVRAFGSGTLDSSSISFFYAVDGGSFQSAGVNSIGGDDFEVVLTDIPCESTVEYYVKAELTNGFELAEPFGAELSPNEFTVGECADPVDPCPADLTGSGVVNVFDLLELLGDWGACEGCPADLNGDGVVNVFDLLELLGEWGSCP